MTGAALSDWKDFLEERMEPDFGLLNRLRARNALSEKYIDDIKAQPTYRKRNLMIVDHIIVAEKFEELIVALQDAKQTHLANYLITNGEYKPEFGGDWPLGEKEMATIYANEEYLADLLEICDLLSRLFSTGVINKRQMEFISSKPTSYERNEELLKIMRRGSLGSYWQTIKCLRSTNQSHIAEIFESGGVLVQANVNLSAVGAEVKEVDQEIVASITSILGHRSLPESNRILELVKLGLIGSSVRHSVSLYFHCLKQKEVDHLQDICGNEDLKDIIEAVFNALLKITGSIRVKIEKITYSFNGSKIPFNAFDDSEGGMESHTAHRYPQMKNLPLELMDLILQKSYLSFVAIERKSLGCTLGQDLFIRMASVDFCWFQRLTKRRFKARVWRHLAAVYKDVDRYALYRTNYRYFSENIQPRILISRLRSTDCITDVQTRLVTRVKHRCGKTNLSNMEINEELLHVVRTFSTETKYLDFVGCLEQSKQDVVTKVAQTGGATVKVKVVSETWRRQEQKAQLFIEGLIDLRDMTKSWSADISILTCQLIDGDVEILNSFPDRDPVVWIWSRSQIAFKSLRSLDDQHDLVKLLSCLAKTTQSDTGKAHAAFQRRNIDIDSDQFKKSFVQFPDFNNLIGNLKVGEEEFIIGVTKLREKIYVLCTLKSPPSAIRVFQDRKPFLLQEKIELKAVKFPEDVVSSEKENCLYVIDTCNQCIWKIIRKSDTDYEVMKWLSTGIDWSSLLSISRDGDLLIVRGCSPRSRLEIYGTDANLILSIHLPQDIQFPQHAVETSTGDFIILHECIDEGGAIYATWKWLIWEVSRNGKIIIRRFAPQGLEQELNSCRNLLLDSDDRVLVAEAGKDRVILLDSNFRWNGILIKVPGRLPQRLCHDKAKKQLVVNFELRGLSPIILRFN